MHAPVIDFMIASDIFSLLRTTAKLITARRSNLTTFSASITRRYPNSWRAGC